MAQRRGEGSPSSLARLRSHGPAKPRQRRPGFWEAMQGGRRLVCCWDLTGSGPPMWAQACLLPTQNLKGGFQNLQQSLACFLTEAGTETRFLDSQDTWTSQRAMSQLLPLILGHILSGEALGPRYSGTRRKKRISPLRRYSLLFVQEFLKCQILFCPFPSLFGNMCVPVCVWLAI